MDVAHNTGNGVAGMLARLRVASQARGSSVDHRFAVDERATSHVLGYLVDGLKGVGDEEVGVGLKAR